MLAILPAFGYLHNQGLLYCDFKPDNVIQTEEQLTLIDLGGVVAMGEESDLFGTIGYQAPEIPDVGASIASDLYTVGRTLAVLSFDFAGFQDKKRYATSLPPVNEVPLFGRYEAFHQFLVKATAPDPASRFQSAEEMGEQLIGVLRQVRAIDGKNPVPPPACFSAPSSAMQREASSWQSLPVPAVDPFDPAAGVLATIVISSSEQITALLASTPRSPEVAFRLARSFIEEGAFAASRSRTLLSRGPEQWVARCMVARRRPVGGGAAEGRPLLLHHRDLRVTRELAPRLALAVSYEMAALADPSNGAMPSLDASRLASGCPPLRDRCRRRPGIRQCELRPVTSSHRPR